MKKLLLVLVMVALFLAAGSDQAMAAPGRQGSGVIHYVAVGESLTGIAMQYGVTVEAIMQHNGLSNPNMIYVGQPLVIPGYPGWPGRGYGGPPPGCAQLHTVRMGETLSSIAWKYNIPVQALAECNNLYNQDIILIGQPLCIPGQPSGPSQPAGYPGGPGPVYYHTVAAGEALSTIAARYGVDTWSMVQANNLRDASYIWAGQQLAVPGYQPQPVYQPGPVYRQPAAPPPAYDPGPPAYVPPPTFDKPAAPAYSDDYAPSYHPPSYKSRPAGDAVPPPPDYQPERLSVVMPRTEHPLTVIVNGGQTWADEIYSRPDPDGITTLIVQTGDEIGKQVRVRSGDYEVKGESDFSGEFGASRFVFRYIPVGNYDVWIDDPDTPSEIVPVKVEAGQRVDVFFSKQVRFQGQTFASPDGWILADWKNPSKPGENVGGWSNILVRTPASGLNVMIESEGGGYKAKCFTGSKGPGVCDLAGLMAGIYYIWIDGTDLTLKTYMDGAAYAEFTFARQ